MLRVLCAAACLGLIGAPFQCASDPDPSRRLEESAPESLWHLSEHFEERGDRDAREQTLRYLIERYPRSRYARRAELALAGRSTGEDFERAGARDDSEEPGD